jgi:DNA polymerase III delta prime subunit
MNINNINNYVPWMEKYRPDNFNDIVLDPLNKQILKNVIETSYFPNLLFYGPPGTGKTTTIINLVNSYQEKLKIKNKGLMIHLNASDDRGIDIIRNQINLFVNTNSLFQTGMKFVILDEVDYMTKNAQQALRYLLQKYSNNVRFCLICNYISRIDDGLQNEFIRLRFNQLPTGDIINFLRNISNIENLNMSDNSLLCIQQIYKSDIRSMINFMQYNQDILNSEFKIIDNCVWDEITYKIQNKTELNSLIAYIQTISIKYNMDKKNIIKDYLNYIVRNNQHFITSNFLNFIENIMHFPDCKNTHFVNYSLSKLYTFLLNDL